MNIKGKTVVLRAVEENDLALLHKWANDPETQDAIGLIHFPSSMDYHKNWFLNLKNDPLNQRFAIEAPRAGLIGLSSLMHIDWRNNHAWHGLMIGDVQTRGKGLGIDAIVATMRYAFEELHFERLDGAMIEYNKASYSSYIGLGWKEEGRKKNFYFHKGRYWDQIIIGLTRQEYARAMEKTKSLNLLA